MPYHGYDGLAEITMRLWKEWALQKIAAMAEQEAPEKRPACDWLTNKGKPSEKKCGSEEHLFDVKRRTVLGGEKKEVICQKHLSDAWGRFNVDSAEKIPSRTTE